MGKKNKKVSQEELLFNEYKETEKKIALTIHVHGEIITQEQFENSYNHDFEIEIDLNDFNKLKNLRKYLHKLVSETESHHKRAFEYFVFFKNGQRRLSYGVGNSEYRTKLKTNNLNFDDDTIDFPEIQLPTSYWK